MTTALRFRAEAIPGGYRLVTVDEAGEPYTFTALGDETVTIPPFALVEPVTFDAVEVRFVRNGEGQS